MELRYVTFRNDNFCSQEFVSELRQSAFVKAISPAAETRLANARYL